MLGFGNAGLKERLAIAERALADERQSRATVEGALNARIRELRRDNAALKARLAPFEARERGPRGRFVSATGVGEAAHA